MNKIEFTKSIFYNPDIPLKDTVTEETQTANNVFGQLQKFKDYIFPENELTEEQEIYLELLEERNEQDCYTQWNAGLVYGMEVMKAMKEIIDNPRQAFEDIFDPVETAKSYRSVAKKIKVLRGYAKAQQEQAENLPKNE